MATGTGKRLTPTQTRAARRVRQARRRRLIRYGGISAIALVSFIFILGLILPGLPIPQFGGGSGSGDIFETGAADAANTQTDAANTQASAANTETQAAPSEPNPPAQAAEPAAPTLPPVPWGVHADTLPADMYAANLAQGGVVISYNCPDGCPDIVAQLSDIVYELIDADGKVILMPNPDIDMPISLAATGITRSMDGYNEFVIREFIDLIQENSTP